MNKNAEDIVPKEGHGRVGRHSASQEYAFFLEAGFHAVSSCCATQALQQVKWSSRSYNTYLFAYVEAL